jgi:hypothetical protein
MRHAGTVLLGLWVNAVNPEAGGIPRSRRPALGKEDRHKRRLRQTNFHPAFQGQRCCGSPTLGGITKKLNLFPTSVLLLPGPLGIDAKQGDFSVSPLAFVRDARIGVRWENIFPLAPLLPRPRASVSCQIGDFTADFNDQLGNNLES